MLEHIKNQFSKILYFSILLTDSLMFSNHFILSHINWCQITKIFPVNSFILSQCKWSHSIQPCNQINNNNNRNDNVESSEFLEKLNTAKDNLPSGSTLYQEDHHFSPVISPDPIFNWDAIKTSVNARHLHEQFNVDKIIDLKIQIDGLHDKLTTLKQNRISLCDQYKHNKKIDLKIQIDGLHDKLTTLKQNRISLCDQYKHNKKDPDEIKASARALRNEQKSLEMSFKKLNYEFRKESIHLPNIIHSLTPIDTMKSQNAIKSYHKNICASKNILWSNLTNDNYNEVIGTYYTGRLAELEYTHMNKVNDYWLSRMKEGRLCNIPVCLSDIIRGPALEATSWPNIKSAIRLRPSKNDMLLIEDSNTGINDWLINPHTTDYLVGSASLAAFSAYLMLHRVDLFTNSSLRLISKGCVYMNNHANDISPNLSIDQPHFKSPFHQSKQISVLELSKDWNQCEAGFHILVEELFKFWQHYQPGWSYKMIYTEASNLYACEMLRAVVYTDMRTLADVPISIPLASVSLLGDWISRRITTKLKKTNNNNNSSNNINNANDESYPYMVFMNAWNFQCLIDSCKQIGYLDEYSSANID
ncbi:unnamed protein product [Schistosoma turkestanicum]|nr:unnamed protein product [Schistosoma turkestanicum]